MAKKLSESTKLIRELQLHYTNRQIADILGFKNVGSVNRISRNARNLSKSKLETARNYIRQNNITIHKRTPGRTQVQQKQKKIKLSFDWIVSSLGHFVDAVQPVKDLFYMLNKLRSLSIGFFYYNQKLKMFLISDSHLDVSKMDTNLTTGLFYESSYTKFQGDMEKEINVVQYPVFPFLTVLNESSLDSWEQMNFDELKFEADRESNEDSNDEDEFHYEFIAELEELRFLAFVSMGRG